MLLIYNCLSKTLAIKQVYATRSSTFPYASQPTMQNFHTHNLIFCLKLFILVTSKLKQYYNEN